MSKKYESIQASFKAASGGKAKVSFDDFKLFVDKENSLHGFNLTVPLLQRLYSELDPHKKGYLNENDWKNAFATFNWNDQLLIELKHIIQSSFANCDSVYTFFTNFSRGLMYLSAMRRCALSVGARSTIIAKLACCDDGDAMTSTPGAFFSRSRKR